MKEQGLVEKYETKAQYLIVTLYHIKVKCKQTYHTDPIQSKTVISIKYPIFSAYILAFFAITERKKGSRKIVKCVVRVEKLVCAGTRDLCNFLISLSLHEDQSFE